MRFAIPSLKLPWCFKDEVLEIVVTSQGAEKLFTAELLAAVTLLTTGGCAPVLTTDTFRTQHEHLLITTLSSQCIALHSLHS